MTMAGGLVNMYVLCFDAIRGASPRCGVLALAEAAGPGFVLGRAYHDCHGVIYTLSPFGDAAIAAAHIASFSGAGPTCGGWYVELRS